MKPISQLMWNGKVCDNYIWGKKDERRTEAKQQDAGEGEEDGEDELVYILRSFKTTVFCVREQLVEDKRLSLQPTKKQLDVAFQVEHKYNGFHKHKLIFII